jgi:hypothetical protein
MIIIVYNYNNCIELEYTCILNDANKNRTHKNRNNKSKNNASKTKCNFLRFAALYASYMQKIFPLYMVLKLSELRMYS